MTKTIALLFACVLSGACTTYDGHRDLFEADVFRPGSARATSTSTPARASTATWSTTAPLRLATASDSTLRRTVGSRTSEAALERQLREQLRTVKVQGLRFEDEPTASAVVRAIVDQTGLPILVHPSVDRAFDTNGVRLDIDLEHPIRVRDALNALTRLGGAEVVWVVRPESVLVTTKAKAPERMALRMHDLRPLTFGRTDFIAPRIDRIRLIDDLEDDDGGGPFGGVGEVTRALEDEEIATLVQESIAPGTWDDEHVSIEAANGFLIVRHTPQVQREIARFLDSLGF